MAKLPSSFRTRNRTTRSFREQFFRFPAHVQQLTRDASRLFDCDPDHPSLRRHRLIDKKSGKHAPDSISVSITMQYRAIYVSADGMNVWYWIGTHAQYNSFTGGGG